MEANEKTTDRTVLSAEEKIQDARVKRFSYFSEDWSDNSSGDKIVAQVRLFHQKLTDEMKKVIVGQSEVIDLVVIALMCKGHVLLEGVPGLGKTLMFKTLSKLMNLTFQHVQFTPDLMPSDILGTEIIQESSTVKGQRELKFMRGPIFCHFLLTDEVNRTSPKTQSALLQAMQDREVSIGNHTHKLEEPFFVLATQNPIDQEGTYPLPEAQLDRFMFNIYIEYPTYDDEIEIAKRFTRNETPSVSTIITKEDILSLQQMVRGMLISDSLLKYAVDIVVATRPRENHSIPYIAQWVEWGAGPRASLNLILAAKARALLKGRFCVASEDIRAVAPSVLRHRIKLNFSAEAEGIQSAKVIQKILEEIPEIKQRRS